MTTPDGIGRVPRGINDGKGFVFISHLGEVLASVIPVRLGWKRSRAVSHGLLPPFPAIRSFARAPTPGREMCLRGSPLPLETEGHRTA